MILNDIYIYSILKYYIECMYTRHRCINVHACTIHNVVFVTAMSGNSGKFNMANGACIYTGHSNRQCACSYPQ